MIVSTINRMARGLDYPSLVNSSDSLDLASNISAPGTDWQNASYSLAGGNGLGSVISDLTSGNFTALPNDIIVGLNPATLDLGSYLLVGGLAWLLFKGVGSGRGAGRRAGRKARLVGQIAQDQSLLKAS